MKTIIKLLLILIVSGMCKSDFAQTYGYEMELKDFVQVSEAEFKFNVYLRKTETSENYAIENFQFNLKFNTGILNGGGFENAYLTIDNSETDFVGNVGTMEDNLFVTNGTELLFASNSAGAPGSSVTVFNNNEWKKVATFHVQLTNNDELNNFSSQNPMLRFQSDPDMGLTVLNRCNYTGSPGSYIKDGTFSDQVDNRTLIPEDGTALSTPQLAGYCFTETGNWTDTENWNNALASGHGAYHQSPGTSSTNNVLIKGNVTINSDVSLSQSGSNGGELIVETGEVILYQLTGTIDHSGAGGIVNIWSDGVGSTLLSNPVDLASGTTVTLQAIDFASAPNVIWTTDPPNSGSFGSPNNAITTYTMPSNDVEAIATFSWTDISENLHPYEMGQKSNSPNNRDDLYSSLTIAADASLTVENLYNNHSGGAEAIILKSDATGTASLIHNNSGVNATIERYINDWDQEEKGWHFISSPVSGQDIQPEFIPNDLPAWADLYKWDESWEQEGTYGWWINIKDDDGSLNPDFSDTEFAVGRGYMIAYESPNGDVAKEFSGTINVSNVTLSNLSHTPEAYNNGWHLVGNPFASSIKWNEGSWVKSHIGAIPQIWDESAASYELIDNIGGDGYLIPPHNGFMVYVSPPSGSLTIPEDARVHGDQNWYKSGEEDVFQLIAYDLDKNIWQQTSVRENIDATEDFDLEYDSYFIAGYAPMFYSVTGENYFALNTLPEINETTVIPVSFVKNTSQNFNIELTEAPEEMDVFLTDLKLDIVTNLRNNPEYAFTAEEGDDPNRFLLSFSLVNIDENGFDANFNTWFSDNKLYIRSMLNVNNQLRIFDSKGQLIDQKQFNGEGLHTYHVDLPTGVYIGRLANEKGNCSVKFFVIR